VHRPTGSGYSAGMEEDMNLNVYSVQTRQNKNLFIVGECVGNLYPHIPEGDHIKSIDMVRPVIISDNAKELLHIEHEDLIINK
jgi:hypothetical protein